MSEIKTLILARIEAKRAEDKAAETRRAIDMQIAELFRPAVDGEGSTSQKFDNAKVTVKFGMTRSVDTDKLQDQWSDLPSAVRACFRFKAEAKLAQLRELSPNKGLLASSFITSKPATPSVTVELI